MSRDRSSHTYIGNSAHGNAQMHNGDIYGGNVYTKVHDDFKARNNPSKFFKVGRVFLVLWTEPTLEPESKTSSSLRHRYTIGSGEYVYSKVRKFVVVREGHRSCTCIPIATYNGRGVGKHGVKKSDHAIVYTGTLEPNPFPNENPSPYEEPMRLAPIRVLPDDRNDRLDPASRINFGRLYMLDHNLKVKAFGSVHPGSVEALCTLFMDVFLSSDSRRALQESASQNSSPEHSGSSDDYEIGADNTPSEVTEEDGSTTQVAVVPAEVGTMRAAQPGDEL